MSLIRAALDAYAAAQERQWAHDRTKTVGASEIGLCGRRIWYAKHAAGAAGTALASWGAHIRGTVMEQSFWQPAMRAKYGDRLLYSGPDQQTLQSGPLSATPDGVLTGLPRDALSYLGVKDIGPSCAILVECKTIDPRVNLREAKDENVFQVQVQLGLVRKKHKKLKGITHALISYVDASFWDEVEEYAVEFDPEVFRQAEARALTIFGADQARDMAPEGWIAGGKECEYCPSRGPCGGERRDVPAMLERPLDVQFIAEMEDLAREARAHKDAGDAESAEYRRLCDKMKERLRDKGVRKVPGVVSWWPVSGRTTLSKESREELRQVLRPLGVDLSDYESQGEESDSMRILI